METILTTDYLLTSETEKRFILTLDKKKSHLFFSRLCLLILVIAIICVIVGGQVYVESHETSLGSAASLLEKYHRRTARGIEELVRTFLRLDPASPCDEKSCVQCKTKVNKRQFLGEPIACEHRSEVKNGSCFQCGDECLTFEELPVASIDELRCNERPMRNFCCILAEMGNMLGGTDIGCKNGGQYRCYNNTASEPVCQCESGFQGPRCEQRILEPVSCNCYGGGYKFYEQEKMAHCNVSNIDWTECQMYINGLNCLCSKSIESMSCLTSVNDTSTDRVDNHTTDCSLATNTADSVTGKTTSGTSTLSSQLGLLFLMIALAADNT